MKNLIILLTLTLLPVKFSLAEDNIAEKKTHVLKNIEARIANLTKAKECVTAAQTGDAIKACHEQLQKEQQSIGHGMNKRAKK